MCPTNDGSGYPRGISGQELDLFSRCVAVADVYDALTTNRSYRNKLLPHGALEILMAQSAVDLLDPLVVKSFINSIKIYPPGCLVRLSDGRTAWVISSPEGLPARPNIQVINKDNSPGSVVKLVEHPTLLITETIKTIF